MVLEGSARAVKAGLVPVFVIQSRKKQGKKKRLIVLQILQIFYIHDQLHIHQKGGRNTKSVVELKNQI